MELGASKEKLAEVQAKVAKEKKATKKAFDAGFDVIFNYGYGYCAFAHNICGSEPAIPYWMPDMSKSLPPKFFINPRCPLSAAPGVHTTDPNVDVREAGKSLPAAKVGLGTQSYSPIMITREDEESDPLGGN